MPHEISRRTMLQGLGAVGGAIAAGGFLGACGSGGGSSASSKSLLVGTSIPLTSLDPNLIDTAAFPYRNALFDPLFDQTVTEYKTFTLGPVENWLATSISHNDDYTQYTYKLRTGVKYSDGTPVTAESLVDAFKFSTGPNSDIGPLLAGVKNASIQNGALVIEMDAPTVGYPAALAQWRLTDPTSNAKAKTAPVGSGLFKIAGYQPNSRLDMVRNTHYWKPVKSNVDKASIIMYPTPEAVLSAALAGEIDILQFGLLKDLPRLQKAGWTAYAMPLLDYDMILLNFDSPNPVMRDQRLRQAVSLAVDRTTIIRDVFQNQVLPLVIPMPPNSTGYYPPNMNDWQFNLQKAKQLVEASGVKNPSFTLTAVGGDPVSTQIVEIVKSNLATIGITASITLVDSTTLINNLIAGDFEGAWFACTVGGPDPSVFNSCGFFVPSASAKFLNVYKAFPDYVATYQKAYSVVDPTQRTADFRALFGELLEEAYAIPICQRGILCGQSPNVKGVAYDEKSHLIYTNIVTGSGKGSTAAGRASRTGAVLTAEHTHDRAVQPFDDGCGACALEHR